MAFPRRRPRIGAAVSARQAIWRPPMIHSERNPSRSPRALGIAFASLASTRWHSLPSPAPKPRLPQTPCSAARVALPRPVGALRSSDLVCNCQELVVSAQILARAGPPGFGLAAHHRAARGDPVSRGPARTRHRGTRLTSARARLSPSWRQWIPGQRAVLRRRQRAPAQLGDAPAPRRRRRGASQAAGLVLFVRARAGPLPGHPQGVERAGRGGGSRRAPGAAGSRRSTRAGRNERHVVGARRPRDALRARPRRCRLGPRVRRWYPPTPCASMRSRGATSGLLSSLWFETPLSTASSLGIQISALYHSLWALGAALPTFGGSAGPSLAGVLATASHGGDLTSARRADRVHGLHLVGETGRQESSSIWET